MSNLEIDFRILFNLGNYITLSALSLIRSIVVSEAAVFPV
jgi:hypothetical protein